MATSPPPPQLRSLPLPLLRALSALLLLLLVVVVLLGVGCSMRAAAHSSRTRAAPPGRPTSAGSGGSMGMAYPSSSRCRHLKAETLPWGCDSVRGERCGLEGSVGCGSIGMAQPSSS